jgi:anti-sigma factor RsiW
MALSCRELIDLLAEYRTDTLDPETNHQAETHLLNCSACVEYLRTYEQTIRLAKSALHSPSRATADVDTLVQEILLAQVGARRRSLH